MIDVTGNHVVVDINETIEFAKNLAKALDIPQKIMPYFVKTVYALMEYENAGCGGYAIKDVLVDRLKASWTVRKSYNEIGESKQTVNEKEKTLICKQDYNLYNNHGDGGDVLISRYYVVTYKLVDGKPSLSIDVYKRSRQTANPYINAGEIVVNFDGKNITSVNIDENNGIYKLVPFKKPESEKLMEKINENLPQIDRILTAPKPPKV